MRKKKEWEPHKYLVAAARKTWRWSPARTAVLKRVQIDAKYWKCEKCFKLVTKIEYWTKPTKKYPKGRLKKKIDGAIDHIVPVGKQPKIWEEYPAYYTRMFCDESNYQFLCTTCHQIKTNLEKERKCRKSL